MDILAEKSYQKVRDIDTRVIRSAMDKIDWNDRLIGLRGARGVGKTTLLLQRIKKFLGNTNESLYVSLDNLWFSEYSLLNLVDFFVKRGGKFLFLDGGGCEYDFGSGIAFVTQCRACLCA